MSKIQGDHSSRSKNGGDSAGSKTKSSRAARRAEARRAVAPEAAAASAGEAPGPAAAPLAIEAAAENDDVVITDIARIYPVGDAAAVERAMKAEETNVEEAVMNEAVVNEAVVNEAVVNEAVVKEAVVSEAASATVSAGASTDAAAWASFWAKVLDLKGSPADLDEIKAKTAEVLHALRGLGVRWADVGLGYARIALDNGARAFESASSHLGELQSKLKSEAAGGVELHPGS